MTTPASTDPVALLGDLIGEHGLTEVAFRQAITAPDQAPATRWGSVLQALHRAVGIASGLAAGQTTLPNGYAPDPQPCAGCSNRTAIRIYGLAWHWTCWQTAGCPVPDVDSPHAAVAAPAPTAPTTTPSQGSEVASEPPSPAQDTAPPTRSAPVKSPAKPAKSGAPAPNVTFELDADDELADFARALRKRVPDATDDQCHAALTAWHDALVRKGDPLRFVSSPGYTGVAAYEWLTGMHGVMVKPEALQHEAIKDLATSNRVYRTLAFVNGDVTPTLGRAVTEGDVTAQYLAGARSCELGDGDPDELGPVAPADHEALFKRPCYVQLGTDPNLSGLPVTAAGAFAKLRAGLWLPGPAARYLSRDHGVQLDIAAAYAWPEGRYGRRLAVWCALIAEGRATLSAGKAHGDLASAHALIVLKLVYATFLGGMTRSEAHNDSGTLRHDWHDGYVMQSGVNMLRALDKALANGAELLGALKDSAWFLADQAPIEPVGLTFADQPGKWKNNRWGEITEDIITAHQGGRPGVLRKAITATDTARLEAAS